MGRSVVTIYVSTGLLHDFPEVELSLLDALLGMGLIVGLYGHSS